MACAVVTPLLEPSGNFPAWLEAQGMNTEVARAMDSELGIRDYGVLRACIGDGLVRAELLATARDRLPFGFYAVLRQVVKALQGAEPHDGGMPLHWDDAATSSPGDITLGGLVDALLTLFSGLSRELQLCVQRLGAVDGNEMCTEYSPSPTRAVTLEDGEMHEIDECDINDEEVAEYNNSEREEDAPKESLQTIKREHSKAENNIKSSVGPVITDVLSLHEAKSNLEDGEEDQQIHQQQPQTADETQSITDGEETSSSNVNTHMPVNAQHTTESQEALNNNFIILNDEDMPLEFQFEKQKSTGFSSTRNVKDSSEKKKPFECTVCNKKFSRKYQFRIHQRVHTGEEEMIHSTMCDIAYSQSSQFMGDEQTHEGESTHQCKFCDQSFPYKSMLTDHMQLHTEWRPYQCKICDSSFFRNDHLQMHVRTHTGLRPYQCKMCASSFMRSHHLKVHERTHTGQRPYQCKICNATFICSHHLKVHERKHLVDSDGN